MEKLKTYLTKKNIAYASIACGVIALIMLFMYLSIRSFDGDDFSSLGSLLSSIKNICNLYYLNFVLSLVIVISLAYRFFAMKDISFSTKVTLGSAGIALLLMTVCFPTISAIKGAVTGDLSSILSFESDMDFESMGTVVLLILILQIANASLCAYFMFIKKEFDLQEGESTSDKANSFNLSEMISHFKTYYQSDKGKKNVLIIGCCSIAVVVIVGGISIFNSMKRTSIDLTSTCVVTFKGVSSEGKATINCNVDYDKTNKDLVTFMSSVTYSVENDGALKNDEKVILSATYSEATADGSKVKVENPTKEFDVTGLEVVYKVYAEIPEESANASQAKALEALNTNFSKTSTSSFSVQNTQVHEVVLIASYYEYSEYNRKGTLHYVYRAHITEGYKTYSKECYNYYSVAIGSISSTQTVEQIKPSVNEISTYKDEKTDKEMIDNFKRYKSNQFEVVSENLTESTYTDKKIEQ